MVRSNFLLSVNTQAAKFCISCNFCKFCLKVPAQTVEQYSYLLNAREFKLTRSLGLEDRCLTLLV